MFAYSQTPQMAHIKYAWLLVQQLSLIKEVFKTSGLNKALSLCHIWEYFQSEGCRVLMISFAFCFSHCSMSAILRGRFLIFLHMGRGFSYSPVRSHNPDTLEETSVVNLILTVS